jgi:hypothetical protein
MNAFVLMAVSFSFFSIVSAAAFAVLSSLCCKFSAFSVTVFCVQGKSVIRKETIETNTNQIARSLRSRLTRHFELRLEIQLFCVPGCLTFSKVGRSLARGGLESGNRVLGSGKFLLELVAVFGHQRKLCPKNVGKISI